MLSKLVCNVGRNVIRFRGLELIRLSRINFSSCLYGRSFITALSKGQQNYILLLGRLYSSKVNMKDPLSSKDGY